MITMQSMMPMRVASDTRAEATTPRMQHRPTRSKAAEAMRTSIHVPGGFHGKTSTASAPVNSSRRAEFNIVPKPVM